MTKRSFAIRCFPFQGLIFRSCICWRRGAFECAKPAEVVATQRGSASRFRLFLISFYTLSGTNEIGYGEKTTTMKGKVGEKSKECQQKQETRDETSDHPTTIRPLLFTAIKPFKQSTRGVGLSEVALLYSEIKIHNCVCSRMHISLFCASL